MKKNNQHKSGACAAPILQHRCATILPPDCLGGAIIISQMLESRDGTAASLPRLEVVSMLKIRGSSEKSSEKIIDRLCTFGLMRKDPGDMLCVPAISESLLQSKAKFKNRQAGWDRRRESNELGEPVISTPVKIKTKVVESRKDSSEVVVEVICKNGAMFGVTSEAIATWSAIYKNVQVVSELKKAAAWSQANPSKRKTMVGINRFLLTWLTSASRHEDTVRAVVASRDRGRGFGRGGEYSASEKPPSEENRGSLSLFDDGDDALNLDANQNRRSASTTT